MPKIKPVMAWAILDSGQIGFVSSFLTAPKIIAASLRREGRDAKAVRVRISVVPKAKRKVKK